MLVSRIAIALSCTLALAACSVIRDFDDFAFVEPCEAPTADCDPAVVGCETTTTSDANHCGGCGMACDEGAYCVNSTCRRHVLGAQILATVASGALAAPSVASATSGGVFVAYTHASALTVAGQTAPALNSEVTVARFDALAAPSWVLSMTGADVSGIEVVNDVASTSDGVYVVGQFNSTAVAYASTVSPVPAPTSTNVGASGTYDGFVWALDEAGNYRWHVRIGGAGTTTVAAVTTDASGSVYIAGAFNGTDLRIGSGIASATNSPNAAGSVTSGVYVMKFLANGGHVWTGIVRAPPEVIESFAVDVAGNAYLFSTSSGIVNADAQPQSGDATPRLFRFAAATGALDYFRAYTTAEPAAGGSASIATLPDGRVFVVFHVDADQTSLGDFALSRGTVLAELDPVDGAPSSVRALGPSLLPRALAVDASGALVLHGTIPAPTPALVGFGALSIAVNPSDGTQVFVAGYAPGGDFTWADVFGSAAEDAAGDLAAGDDGSVFLSGPFSANVGFASGTLTYTPPNANAYVVRLDAMTVAP